MIVQKKMLFDIPIVSTTLSNIPLLIENLILRKGKKTFFYINAHCINLSLKDKIYKSIIQKADLVYSGGIGPIWASRLIGKPLAQRTPTPDFIDKIFSLAQKNHWTIYILGSDTLTIKKAANTIKGKYPAIIVGYHNGYFSSQEEKELIKDINRKRPTILLVGMGSPKQEKWIQLHKDNIDATTFWAVGALFEIISQNLKRAPSWMQNIGLEWFYRLLQEPQRLWKRYLLGNTVFLLNCVKEIYRGNINNFF